MSFLRISCTNSVAKLIPYITTTCSKTTVASPKSPIRHSRPPRKTKCTYNIANRFPRATQSSRRLFQHHHFELNWRRHLENLNTLHSLMSAMPATIPTMPATIPTMPATIPTMQATITTIRQRTTSLQQMPLSTNSGSTKILIPTKRGINVPIEV